MRTETYGSVEICGETEPFSAPGAHLHQVYAAVTAIERAFNKLDERVKAYATLLETTAQASADACKSTADALGDLDKRLKAVENCCQRKEKPSFAKATEDKPDEHGRRGD